LARAPRSSEIWQNARRRPRRPERFLRQSRQRPTSAVPSCERYRARKLKKKIIIFLFQLSLVVSYSDADASSPGLTVTESISIGQQSRYLETSEGKLAQIDRHPSIPADEVTQYDISLGLMQTSLHSRL
jgi:hypothetical protein